MIKPSNLLKKSLCVPKQIRVFESKFEIPHDQRNLFEVLINQTKIRFYLAFSNWFGTKRTSVRFQINRKLVNTIWFRFDVIEFWKDSLCVPYLERTPPGTIKNKHNFATKKNILVFCITNIIIAINLLPSSELGKYIYMYLFFYHITKLKVRYINI